MKKSLDQQTGELIAVTMKKIISNVLRNGDMTTTWHALETLDLDAFDNARDMKFFYDAIMGVKASGQPVNRDNVYQLISMHAGKDVVSVFEQLLDISICPWSSDPIADVQIINRAVMDLRRRAAIKRAFAATENGEDPTSDLTAALEHTANTNAYGLTEDLHIWQDIAAEEQAWLFRDLIPRGSVTILAGSGGSGKSTLSRTLALSAMTGATLIDPFRLVCGKDKVLLISQEDNAAVCLRNMKTIWGSMSQVALDEAMRERLLLVTSPLKLLSPDEAKQPQRTSAFNALLVLCQTHKPILVIVDTVRRAGGMVNENDSVWAGEMMGALQAFAEASGGAVLAIHHAAKTSEQDRVVVRGSSALVDEARAAWTLAKLDDGTRILKNTKMNLGKEHGQITLSMNRFGVLEDLTSTPYKPAKYQPPHIPGDVHEYDEEDDTF